MTRGAAVACLKAIERRTCTGPASVCLVCMFLLFGVLPVRVQVKLTSPSDYTEAFGPFGSTRRCLGTDRHSEPHWCPQCERGKNDTDRGKTIPVV